MIPVIAIVGRPNVGKSSLLNAFARRRISIVDPMPGVTRDRVSHEIEIGDRTVELVDTGGIGIVDSQALEADVEYQIQIAIDTADIILFITDIRSGLEPLDRRVAESLRRSAGKKPVLLLANKADDAKFDNQTADFYRLGFERLFTVSANCRRNLDDVIAELDDILFRMGATEKREEPVMRLAIVGKRNSGKSTLVNRLADAERCIVSEIPGTTRDSVDVRFRFREREFIAIDTAGLRRQHSVENSIEFYSQHRALRSIRRADVVLLLLDCESITSQVDRKTAGAILDAGKPVVIGVNKWDLAGDLKTGQYEPYVRQQLPGLNFAPIACLSGETGSNVWQVIALAQSLYEESTTRVSTGELNRVLQQVTERRPPAVSGKRAKFYFATQVAVGPPTLVLFVNNPALINNQYRRYLLNRFHEILPFHEVPIRLVFRARTRGEELSPNRRRAGTRARSR